MPHERSIPERLEAVENELDELTQQFKRLVAVLYVRAECMNQTDLVELYHETDHDGT